MDFKDFDEGLKAFSVNENLSKELYDKKDESVLKVNSDVLYFFLITEGAVEYLKDIMRIGSSSEKIKAGHIYSGLMNDRTVLDGLLIKETDQNFIVHFAWCLVKESFKDVEFSFNGIRPIENKYSEEDFCEFSAVKVKESMLTWDDEGELTKAKKLGVAPDTVLNLQKQIICAINAFEPADWLIRYVELHPGKKDSYQKKVRIANDKIVDFFDNHAGELGIKILKGKLFGGRIDERQSAAHIIDRMQKFPNKKEELISSLSHQREYEAIKRVSYAIVNEELKPE